MFLTQRFVYAAPLIAAAAFICMLNRRWRGPQANWRLSGYVTLTSLVLFVPISGLIRPDLFHQSPFVILDAALLMSLVAASTFSGTAGRIAVFGVLAFFALITWDSAKNTMRRAVYNVGLVTHPGLPDSIASLCHPPQGLERDTCLRLDPFDTDIATYIQQHTTPDEKVYDGAGHHDKLFATSLIFYFSSERDSPTKWYDLHPGVQTTAPIQSEIIHDLDREHVRYVLRDTRWDEMRERNDSNVSSGVFDLDRYIDANYQPVQTFERVGFGKVVVLRRSTPFSAPDSVPQTNPQ